MTTLHRTILGSFSSLLLVATFGAQAAHAAINNQMDLGSTGSDVTQLQTYLTNNPDLYPSGLVTGYFGMLTQAGVQKFQAGQGIVSSGSPATTGYGRVGPTTLARLNVLMGSGNGASSGTVPVIGTVLIQNTNTAATFTWSTNEPTQGQVYWATSPIQAYEATGPNQTPFISGTLALDAGGLQTNHSVTVSNLQSNTTYYYLIRVIDSSGDMSITWPSFSFHTNQ